MGNEKAPVRGNQGGKNETGDTLLMPRRHVAVKDNEQPERRGRS